MLRYETALWSSGVAHVAGVDEAGMSPLAGPVAAAAVIFARGTRIPEVDDSKRLTAEEREELAPVIRERALAWAVAYAEVDEIDCINIYWAGLAAMRRAIEALSPAAEHLLIDARRLRDVPLPQQPIIKGDTKSLSIAAASILAKTARDARMRALDAVYPGYGFAQHKGYPVPAHFRALRSLGPCPIHRRSFALVREVLGLPPLPPWPARSGVDPSAAAIEATTSRRVELQRTERRREARLRAPHSGHMPTRLTRHQCRRCRCISAENFGAGVSAVDDDVDRVTQ